MISVNLLKPEKKDVELTEAVAIADEKRESKINVTAIIGAVVFTIAVIGILYISQSANLTNKRRILVERKARKVELDNILKTLKQLENTKALLDRKVKIIGDLKNRQKVAVKMMDELSDSLPQWVWLSRLSFTGGILSIQGKALSNNLIADLINNLQSTNYFTNIRLISSVRKREQGLDIFHFSITCNYLKKIIPSKAV